MKTRNGHFATNPETGNLILGPVPANSLQSLQEDMCELFNMLEPQGPDDIEIRKPIAVPVPVPVPPKEA